MTHDKYDNDILKTLKSIDASLKSIAKSVQPVKTADVYGDGTNENRKLKDLIDKEAEEMKDDN